MTKKAIGIDISSNYTDRKIDCIGIGEGEYDPETKSFWINTNFQNPDGEDDYLTISFNIPELLRVLGECISDQEDF